MLQRFEQFTTAISSLYRFVQKIMRDEMEKYGLKGSAAQYLLALARYPEGLTAAELCDICDRDKAAVSRILNEMEAKGLVTRLGDGKRQYRIKLALTPAGRDAADYVDKKASAAAALAGRDLTEDQRADFYRYLSSLAANIERLSREGIPTETENKE